MASSGDPSTFSFTMDAMPGYTIFNPKRKVLCAIQILEDTFAADTTGIESVFSHSDEGHIPTESDFDDSYTA